MQDKSSTKEQTLNDIKDKILSLNSQLRERISSKTKYIPIINVNYFSGSADKRAATTHCNAMFGTINAINLKKTHKELESIHKELKTQTTQLEQHILKINDNGATKKLLKTFHEKATEALHTIKETIDEKAKEEKEKAQKEENGKIVPPEAPIKQLDNAVTASQPTELVNQIVDLKASIQDMITDIKSKAETLEYSTKNIPGMNKTTELFQDLQHLNSNSDFGEFKTSLQDNQSQFCATLQLSTQRQNYNEANPKVAYVAIKEKIKEVIELKNQLNALEQRNEQKADKNFSFSNT